MTTSAELAKGESRRLSDIPFTQSPPGSVADDATLPGIDELGKGFLGVAETDPRKPDGTPSPHRSTHYLLPFEIVSVHLLVVLVAAAYLARAKRRAAEGAKA